MKTTDKPIIVEETFNTPIEVVWNAITDIKQMVNWYFENIPDFKPKVGFETQINVVSNERNFLHRWKVIEVRPMEMIKYTWKYDGYPGKSTSAFELFEQNDLTTLRLTVENMEDFPDDIPEFKRESCIGGWEYFINKRLKEFLAKS
ncbi:MAG: SRPBCC domain-containing protein [Ignavibacteria bacterium]|jgi:uncharacterized protein YndB with AHSA1/START domain